MHERHIHIDIGAFIMPAQNLGAFIMHNCGAIRMRTRPQCYQFTMSMSVYSAAQLACMLKPWRIHHAQPA